MNKEDYENIKEISFPNTVTDSEKCFYGSTGINKWRFEQVFESGEMAGIAWIAVYKDEKKIAYMKQSICDIYFK